MVLEHPEIPLHNNPAELGARLRVRKRVVSYGPRSAAGAKAWDTMETLLGTARKLGVNFFQYIRDRVSGAKQMTSLAELIDIGGSCKITGLTGTLMVQGYRPDAIGIFFPWGQNSMNGTKKRDVRRRHNYRV